MERELEGTNLRRIRVHTREGYVEGDLATNESVSTLHYLNVVAVTRDYLPLQPPLVTSADWFLDDAPLEIALESVLFVAELSDYRPADGDPNAAKLYTPIPVRLRVNRYTVDGQVHVPAGAEPVDRLNHSRHAFVAMTSASVLGPDAEFGAGFVALNRSHVSAVQTVAEEDVDPAMVADESLVRV